MQTKTRKPISQSIHSPESGNKIFRPLPEIRNATRHFRKYQFCAGK
jgi:hypothetical protein